MIRFHPGRLAATALLAAFAGAILPVAAHAHGDESHETAAGPNGGLFASAGNYHVELLASDGAITVWLTDIGGEPVSTEGMAATVALYRADERVDLGLAPAGGHNLAVEDPRIQPAEGGRLVLQATAPDGEPIEARFDLGSHGH